LASSNRTVNDVSCLAALQAQFPGIASSECGGLLYLGLWFGLN